MKKNALAKMSLAKQIALILSVTLLVSGALAGVYIWEMSRSDFNGPGGQYAMPSIEHEGKTYVRNTRLRTTLFIGLDSYEEDSENFDSYNNVMQADFLLLLVLNEEDKTLRALHINRDTMAEMDVLGVTGQPIGTSVCQIALSHTYGTGKGDSCRNVTRAVSRLLGNVRIDHYMSVTMDGVQALNDAVGGVTVEVIGDFSKVDPTLIEGETVTLHGPQALTYVRARKDVQDQTNLSRMERQRQYLDALYKTTSDAIENDKDVTENIIDDMKSYIVTDYTVQQMELMLEQFGDYEFLGIRSIKGESVVNEHMEFYPDETDLKEALIEIFYKLDN